MEKPHNYNSCYLIAILRFSKMFAFLFCCAFPDISSAMELSSSEEFSGEEKVSIKLKKRKHTRINYSESEVSSEGSFSASREEDEDSSYREGSSLRSSSIWSNYRKSLEESTSSGSEESFDLSKQPRFSSKERISDVFDPPEEKVGREKRKRKKVNYCELSLNSPSLNTNFSSGEDSPPAKRSKKLQQKEGTHLQTGEKKKKKAYAKKFSLKDESDDEETPEYLGEQSYKSTGTSNIVNYGIQLKLLANTYLKNMDQMANVFVPFVKLDFKALNGSIKSQYSFFKTDKGEICVFVSGGVHNIWEKNVGYVNKKFFGNNLKIIRERWIKKHIPGKNIAKDFKDKEDELHSEFYYDLFFEHFFVPQLVKIKEGKERKGYNFEGITIKCFSWWAVCNGCEGILSRHGNLLVSKNVLSGTEKLSYQIIARRRYQHCYPPHSAIQKTFYMGGKGEELERKAWHKIWQKITEYDRKKFPTEEEKELFWTTSKEGLEVCKWIGQAFKENEYRLDGQESRLGRKGDILKYYKEKVDIQGEDLERFGKFLQYLKEKNWDLSCWYCSPYPSGGQTPGGKPIEERWKKYWRQMIMPHYNWQDVEDVKGEKKDKRENYHEVDGSEGDGEQEDCQMCGYEDLQNYHFVFHEKFNVSDKYELLLQSTAPAADSIKRPNLLVLYEKEDKLFGQVKDKDPIEITVSDDIKQELIEEIKELIRMKEKPIFENRFEGQQSLFNFTFHKGYTLSNKFWLSKEEKKRRACLKVGSVCVSILQYQEEQIIKLFEEHPDYESKAKDRAAMSNYDALERAEKELKQRLKQKKQKSKTRA